MGEEGEEAPAGRSLPGPQAASQPGPPTLGWEHPRSAQTGFQGLKARDSGQEQWQQGQLLCAPPGSWETQALMAMRTTGKNPPGGSPLVQDFLGLS